MTPGDIARRTAAGLTFALTLAVPTLSMAQVYTGPDPALAPGQDRRAAGTAVPSTVHREADGTPYVLRGPDEKQFLSAYNVTWIDKDHVVGPPGFGGFD